MRVTNQLFGEDVLYEVMQYEGALLHNLILVGDRTIQGDILIEESTLLSLFT